MRPLLVVRTGHFVFCDFDFFSAEVSEGYIGYFVFEVGHC
jgi:hypothetical protein